jgi:hypothetical protein
MASASSSSSNIPTL